MDRRIGIQKGIPSLGLIEPFLTFSTSDEVFDIVIIPADSAKPVPLAVVSLDSR
jgi:hypothetical protein